MNFFNLKFIFRRFSKQKLNTAFHIVGLSLGITVCLLIGLFLKYELSFDSYHSKANRIYRINSVWTEPSKKNYHYSTPTPLAETMRKEVTGPEVIAMAHALDGAVIDVSPEKRFKQDKVLFTEPQFLDVFDIEAKEGNPKEVLRKPFQAVLTESTAKKFYGDADPIGKTFKYKNKYDVSVGAVIKDIPSNTHLQASILMSYVPDDNYFNGGHSSWSFVSGTVTYVVMPKNYDLKKLQVQLTKIADAKINSLVFIKGQKSDFDIQPLRDIHFDSKYSGGSAWVSAVNVSWLWFFAAIGLAVLVLACINFINLSTAQAMTRAKEVGVRKSIGAGRIQLVFQFLKEAWILAAIAAILSIAIVQLSLPYINSLLEKEIPFDLWHSPMLLVSLIIGTFITGLLAGLYPAWITARFNPVEVLKTGAAPGAQRRSDWLRKGLLVTQFTISASLLIALLVISEQVNYLHNKGLGFEKDNILLVSIEPAKASIFANELKQIPQVKNFTFQTNAPSSSDHWGTMMSLTNIDDPGRADVKLIVADENYFGLYGLHLVSGRFTTASDTALASNSIPENAKIKRIVVNEKLVRTLGLGTNEQALGKRFWFGFGGGKGEIVGVVADFNLSSLHEAITPMLITQNKDYLYEAGIKIAANTNSSKVVSAIESAWKKAHPNGVFDFRFLDQQIDSFYKAESRLYFLFKIFSAMAMVICCLGLWGLASFAAEQRVKEIGIRKVLGASVSGLIALLSKDFLKIVGIALVISTPLAYYFMHRWLEGFAFRVGISYWVFVITAGVIILITIITVGSRAIRAASANPVNSLRSE